MPSRTTRAEPPGRAHAEARLRAIGLAHPTVLHLFDVLEPVSDPVEGPSLGIRSSEAPGTCVRGLARVPVVEILSRTPEQETLVAEVHVRRQIDDPLGAPENVHVLHDPSRPLPLAYAWPEPWFEAVLELHGRVTGQTLDPPSLGLD